ncbi:MAG: type toxin-antitoxin system VapC family toxin [Burkholderiales bacterium]|jgi:predicted nucleic acid-binding protein|nr:type toxin-antitoxin system VapC family toxin [Burkholderiales bacterium]
MVVVIDSNIIIDYFKGIPEASLILQKYKHKYISFITWIECLVKIPMDRQDPAIDFLSGFDLVTMDTKLMQESLKIRQATKLKLPDAIIYATAKIKNASLITRNSKDYGNLEKIIIPYSVI